MRIGFDAKRAFFNHSGLGNYSRSILLLLEHYFPDNEYVLYTPATENSIPFYINMPFEIHQPETHISRLLSSYWRSFKMGADLKKGKLDIFHGLSNELPFDIKKSNTKSIVTIHDLIFLRFPQFFSKIDYQIYLHKFKQACIKSDRIIAVSEQTKRDIVDFFQISPDKISISYQGCGKLFWNKVDTYRIAEVKHKYNLPEQFILNVGTIEPRKNMYNLISSLIYAKHDLKIVAIGRPVKAYMKKLSQFIRDNNLGDRVLFLSNIPSKDFPAIYQAASLFIYPSFFEGFGIPILEAMVSGIPVVTSKGSCFPETGGKAAMYINPNSPEEIASISDKILEDDMIRKDMIKKGYKQAEKFSDEAVVNSLMKVYNSVSK